MKPYVFSLALSFVSPFTFAEALPSSTYIIGGEEDTTSLWQVKISIPTSQGNFLCGGSIIDSQWVVSAAHCFIYNNLYATQANIETIEGTQYIAKQIYTPESYEHTATSTQFSIKDDIALLKIDDGRFPLDHIIQVTTEKEHRELLAQLEQEWRDEAPRIANLKASGYGLTELGYGSEALRSVGLTGVPDNADYVHCQYNGRDTENTLCAISPTTEVKNTCRGDSGGPLVWQNPALATDDDGGWRLAGLTSWGDTRCQSYGIYTALASYLDWIEQVKTGQIDPHQSQATQDPVEVSAGHTSVALVFFMLSRWWYTRRQNKKKSHI